MVLSCCYKTAWANNTIIIAILIPTAVNAYPLFNILTKSFLYLKFHNKYISNKTNINPRTGNPAKVFLNNKNIKKANKVFDEFAKTHLLKDLYHDVFISRAELFFLSANKYPGVHINKNAKGIEQIIFHGEIPISRARLYLA